MPLRFGSEHNHADYDIVRVEQDRVFIIDLDLGNKSVTNDAEYVYSVLQSMWPNRRVIYRDSIGNWDEMVVDCDPENIKKYPIEVCYIVFRPYKEHLPNI